MSFSSAEDILHIIKMLHKRVEALSDCYYLACDNHIKYLYKINGCDYESISILGAEATKSYVIYRTTDAIVYIVDAKTGDTILKCNNAKSGLWVSTILNSRFIVVDIAEKLDKHTAVLLDDKESKKKIIGVYTYTYKRARDYADEDNHYKCLTIVSDTNGKLINCNFKIIKYLITGKTDEIKCKT